MFKLRITEEGITNIIATLTSINNDKGLVNTENAVKMSADLLADRWKGAVAQAIELEYQGNRFVVHRRTGSYERSIQIIYPFLSKLDALIEATAKYADAIENGVPPHDMKPGLLKGKEYVRIPFRHGTGQGDISPTGLKNMPESIHAMMKNIRRLGSSNVGQRSKIVTDLENKRHTYTWKTGQYSGMVREGKKHHHQFVTFRTVSRKSDPSSWWHPGTPARPISKAISEMSMPILEEILKEGLERDLEALS